MLEDNGYNYFDCDISFAKAARLVSPIQRILERACEIRYPRFNLGPRLSQSTTALLESVLIRFAASSEELLSGSIAIFRFAGIVDFDL